MTAPALTSGHLEPRLVGKIKGTFCVRSYQRGYRWGRHEVDCLLNDIEASGAQSYYLQPVVVKRMDSEHLEREVPHWELVDGQQRLTTLFLILRCIQKHLPSAKLDYSLVYETRHGSEAYLQEPDEKTSRDNIDFLHIFHAATRIRAWFQSKPDPAMAAINFYKALSETVHVIWYEAPDDVDARTLFIRLNVGRIPLTDAELVKALLLSRAKRAEEIAAQWDSIERDLRVPEVWSFVTARADEAPTHISLLLDVLAGQTVGDRPIFYTFEKVKELIEKTSPEDVWDSVVYLHALVQGWYDDRRHFHRIGYLISTGSRFADLVEVAKDKTKYDFEVELTTQIRARLGLSQADLAGLNYEQHYQKCTRALLLMNVETVLAREHSHERYSFHAHAAGSWSLEHIDAQSAESLSTADEWTTWLDLHRVALTALPGVDGAQRDALVARIDVALGDLTAYTFHRVEEEVNAFFKGASGAGEDPMHSIVNLALLGKGANSALNNSVFAVKRDQILAMDKAGEYIPVCTRNVFLKYYTDSDAQQIHFWGPQDRTAYLRALATALGDYLTAEAS